MKIRILSVSSKSQAWVVEGFHEYAKRFSGGFSLELVEIPAEKRGGDVNKIIEREGEKILGKVKTQNLVVALDVKGKLWSTETLANNLKQWQAAGRNVDLLIGGADGLSSACLKRAEISWSLSPLTFPHLLVRVILAEQLYRAVSILQQHPYHRA